ncbi:rRNA maturation RNase YbeY [Paenisporosarcina cavernae]|uniref:Endoribonuclease YbeY n=1 Tax=Paenisporosarcina cavernae TaxID=2320858 RepID=A0A385YVS9_9BACL|nr:rRNA maturation RNase YbeY [Paenisporosarcina cavernae]AYC29613.1 rRNA maturation RNase YbeY [Paenisporosarcina cavernae]
MTIEIDFIEELEIAEETKHLVSKVITHAAVQEGIKELAELSVTFTSNAGIQKINAEYRGKDSATDVISFAMEEGDTMPIQGMTDIPRILGDIIISTERAVEQAAEYGHSSKREIAFLALHGFLHLLGYDHMTEQEEKVMTRRQEEILESLGLTRDVE